MNAPHISSSSVPYSGVVRISSCFWNSFLEDVHGRSQEIIFSFNASLMASFAPRIGLEQKMQKKS
jgi:hypothetical protein